MKNINIQWVTRDSTLFELDWLKEVIGTHGTDMDIHVVNYFEEFKTDKNSLVICSHAVNYRVCLDALRQNGKHYGVFLLSDENLAEQCEWLHDPGCVFCIRNYVHPMYIQHPKVMTIGLGYKRHFQEFLTRSTEERQLLWSFAGTPHGERRDMFEIFKDLKPHQTHNCSGFGAADSLTTRGYAEMLENSKFALCPPGQDSMDSFRLYEALEAGCIPVTTARTPRLPIYPSYWHGVMQSAEIYEIPFVIRDNWETGLYEVKEILYNDKYKETQEKCQAFWQKVKKNWQYKIRGKLSLLNLECVA